LLWYNTATGGTGNSTAPTPSTNNAGSTNYFVTQTINGCESQRVVITVNVLAATPAPVVISPVTYCQNAIATPLTATGTNLLWYNTANGGIGSTVAPLPVTTSAGNTAYYVSQTLTCGESSRALINVMVTATPAAPLGLQATGITLNSAVLNWNLVPGIFYTVDYKKTTAINWTNIATAISTSTVTVTNLEPGTSYDWRVTSNCSATIINNYTVSQFTTSTHNNQITDIKNGFGIKISPNPVQSDAIIDYIVPGNGTVSITVINAYGQKMMVLYNAMQLSGQYTLSLTSQLSGLAKGCYFLRLQQNGKGHYVQFIKM